MEITITQSGTLYLAQHGNTTDRHEYFRHMRGAALDQGHGVRTVHALTDLPPGHCDNGR